MALPPRRATPKAVASPDNPAPTTTTSASWALVAPVDEVAVVMAGTIAGLRQGFYAVSVPLVSTRYVPCPSAPLTATDGWHTGPMADNDDIKERMRAALEAKNKKSSKSTPHGQAPTDDKGHEHSGREGAKREFRRKSGG